MKERPSPHQHPAVKNRNARARAERERNAATSTPSIATYTGPDYVPAELDGRMKVQARREIKIVVPHDFSEGHLDYTEPSNPLNQLGAVPEQCVPLVTSADFESFMASFNKRCNFMQAGAADDLDDVSFKEAQDIISALPGDLFSEWDDNDRDRARWMDKFDPGKKARMAAAYAEIPGATSAYIGKKDLSVKQECLIKRDDPEWAPRVIYAGNDVFNAVTGPASMVVMERLVEMTRTHKITFGEVKVEYAYKTTDVKLCDFLFDDPELKDTIEGDYSRNDREQRSRTALLYDAFLAKIKMPQWFRTLLLDLEHYTVVNHRYGFRAKLAFQLPTGTTSTTPRNSLYNTLMFAVSCRRQKRRARAVILGDDLLARINKRFDLDAWIRSVASFKMVLKAKAPRINGEATFLSRRIFAEVDRPCMVPLLGKMLVRFNVRSTTNQQVTDSQYMAGKALSYAYECRHVPFLSDLFMRRYEMEGDNDKVTPQDMTWFAKTSGLGREDLIEAIKHEPVKIDEWDFGAWCCEQYDLDLEDVRELFESIVLNPSCEMVDVPNLSKMQCDLG
uniref:RNA-dependent RNA polymerase n=1 Tax=Pleurotus pulmonarius virga-like virus 1 TaxID=3231516 RepID=A0AAU8HXR1_9VIRU